MKNTTAVPNIDDRRANKRIGTHPILDLKILFASETPGLLGKNISGSTVDVSTSGLGLCLDCEVPINSTLDVRVMLKGSFKEYFLSGKVCWCKPSDEAGMFLIGISLHKRTNVDTDLESWSKELFS